MSSLLDLPMQKQIEYAARRNMSHADWVIHQQKLIEEFALYGQSIKDAPESKLSNNPDFQNRVNAESSINNRSI